MRFSQAALWLMFAVGCFHAAYFGAFGFCIFGFLLGVVQLARLPTPRQAFAAGLIAGALCYPAQLLFFWGIFGAAALGLWMVLILWLAFFTTLAQIAWQRLGGWRAALLIPCLWTGLEYFRSELYFLRFSWLNIGYALPLSNSFGMYGLGFVAAFLAAGFLARLWRALAGAIVLMQVALLLQFPLPTTGRIVIVAGAQMEFPSESEILGTLDQLAQKFPRAELLVLSEYTLGGPPTPMIKSWCHEHGKHLVIGGKDPAEGGQYFNTAFVIGPSGEIVFKQAKSVPIQFFNDGLPARDQQVWDSPWGKLGLCICYDLSYRRFTDRLVRLGARALIVPTMDLEEWDRHEHELHRLVAPMRSAEYGIPIFRVASSGISQLTDARGIEIASAPFAARGATLSGKLLLTDGRLPLDAYLAPLCVTITAATLLWQLLTTLRRQPVNRPD